MGAVPLLTLALPILIALPRRPNCPPSVADALSSSAASPPSLPDRAPPWSDLRARVLDTPTGARLRSEADLRSSGRGPPHPDATLRLFDDKEDESDALRVTLYRDSAAWCPYCQKVWIVLEEMEVPYRTHRVPLNAYGDKPAWYTRAVDGGKLPALDLDGELHTESADIVRLLDAAFPDRTPQMVPSEGTAEARRTGELIELEKELQSAWFSLVFYPVEGAFLDEARQAFLDALGRVDTALAATPGPWFLGGDAPSIADVQFVSSVERIVASVLYWKGMKIRDGRFANVDRWLDAFERRPSYMSTKSDYYTLVTAIPSQNGPGYAVPEAREIADRIYGLDGAWDLPLNYSGDEPPHRTLTLDDSVSDEEAARHEAAYCLVSNYDRVVPFACRGAGELGRPSFHAELSDPYAEPNVDFGPAVDVCLRHVAAALLDGTVAVSVTAAEDLAGSAGDGELREGWGEYKDDSSRVYYWNDYTGEVTWTPPTRQLDTCLAYLRDRIGVPRDMGQRAAMQLRAHLNWAIGLLK